MKYIGLLLIVVAGGGLGLYSSHRLFRRVTLLRQLERVLESLLRLLTYSARPMGELWRQLAENESLAGCPLLMDTAAGLEQQPFSGAFRAAVDKSVSAGLLQPPERQLLLEFAAECGQYDVSRQAAQIRGCIRGLEEVCHTAAQQATARGQVYRVMGLTGGVALALLLL